MNRVVATTALIFLAVFPAWAELADTIVRIKPSIVIVGSFQATGNPQFSLHGTGFAVAGNLVATNAHVVATVRGAPEGSTLAVQVAAGNGKGALRNAVLESVDPVHDLALLSIDGPPLPALTVGDSDSVREGASVAFVGFPIGGALGFSPVTHRGTVSAITGIAPPTANAQGLSERLIRAIKSGPFDIFQLDATAYPGNSGGPLFDPKTGSVLGVVNMVFVKGSKESALSQPSGISYAIPSRYLTPLIDAASKKLTPLPASANPK